MLRSWGRKEFRVDVEETGEWVLFPSENRTALGAPNTRNTPIQYGGKFPNRWRSDSDIIDALKEWAHGQFSSSDLGGFGVTTLEKVDSTILKYFDLIAKVTSRKMHDKGTWKFTIQDDSDIRKFILVPRSRSRHVKVDDIVKLTYIR